MSSLTDRIGAAISEDTTRRAFCRAGISVALLSSSSVPILGQDTTPGSSQTQATAKKNDGDDKSKKAADGKSEEKSDQAAPKPVIKQPKPKELIVPEQFPKGWFYFPAEGGLKLESTWKLGKDENGKTVLQCLGKPYGYLRTQEAFDNYELRLRWRYPSDPNGNSGILLHTDTDRIWPKSIQVQLHRPKAGSVFPIGDAKSDNKLEVKDISKPLKVWNECVIRCLDDKISLEINEKKIGEVTGCQPKKGRIALQSEGSEIHFQQITIKKL